MKKSLIIILCVFLFSGCAAKEQNVTTEQNLKLTTCSDVEETINQGRTYGIIIGGTVSGLAAHFIANDQLVTGIGALAGGAVGGYLGNLFGKNIAQKKEELCIENAKLDNVLLFLRDEEAKIMAQNQKNTAQIAKLNDEYTNLQKKKKKLNTSELEVLRKEYTSLNTELAKNEELVAVYTVNLSSATARIENRSKELNEKLNAEEKELEAFIFDGAIPNLLLVNQQNEKNKKLLAQLSKI